MIKYNNNTINDWYYGASNLIKVYRNNAIVFYKVSGESPTPEYKVCFAVVDDISQYSETEFEDVYDKASEKWYKLNNLNQYEEYGVYGSGRTSCEGSTSRLPQGYTEVEYIRQNSNYNAYINTGVIIFDNTTNTYTITTRLTSEFHSNLGCATIISCERVNSPYDGLGYRYKCSSTVDELEFFGGHPNYSSSSVDNGDGTRTITFTSTGNSSFTTDVPLSYMAAFSSTTYGANASWRYSDSTIYSATVVKNGVTVRDFVPAKRNSDSKYGLYDLISDTFYLSPNGNNFSGGSAVTPTDCVTTYEGKLTIDDANDGEDYSTHYLTLVAQTDNVAFTYSTATSSNKLKYSLDSGETWSELGNNQSTTSINSGDKILFKASGLTVNQERGIGKIIPSASASVEGNIMSLAYGDNFSGQTVIPNNFQFRKLFSGVTSITSAENMALPATTIKKQCYSQMFQACTNLTKTPKVIGSSAMTWDGDYCFSDMFNSCTSLTTVPSGLLPAKNLSSACYWCLFQNCSNLTNTPLLLATTLVSNCYFGMFSGCISLNHIEALFTTAPSSSYMNNWVSGITNSGTFYKNSEATWSTSCGASTYPCGWAVQDYVEPAPIKYEYIYSGGSWVNVGEVSGSIVTIKSPEYVGNKSSANGQIDLGVVLKDNTRFQVKLKPTKAGGGAIFGEINAPSDNDDYRFFWASTRIYYDYGNSRLNTRKSINTIYEYEIGNYYIKDLATSTNVLTGATQSGVATAHTRNIGLFTTTGDITNVYYMKIFEGDTLIRDFIPWTDMNGNYGMFDKVSMQTFLPTASLSGSSNVTDVEVGGGYEYPIEYTVKQDPPNNLVFSSMAEAEAYECPWVGMHATIDGSGYTFSGDSQSGYEWVYNPSRLPDGYTEVEYVQNTTHAYLDIGFIPNQDTRIVCDMQQVTTNDFPRLWGAGEWNSANGLNLNYEGGYLQISWFGKTSWTKFTSVPTNNDRHVYDLNKNYLYVDETLIGSNTYTTKTAAASIGIFCEIRNDGQPPTSGNNPQYWSGEYFKGKLFSFKVYDNGTLVRDLVPCTRDNDNEVGAYDLVNDVFYTVPSGYTTDKLVAGSPI